MRLMRKTGQVLPLACVAMLVCALMLMATFSLTNAIHERTRIQAAADAQAYSAAVIEARAFNTISFMNRAIAGAIVAEMSIHLWRALAQQEVDMYQAGAMGMVIVAVTEFAQCPPYYVKHCIDGIEALAKAAEFMSKYNDKKSDVEGKDNQWKEAVKAFSDMIEKIYKDEKALLSSAKDELSSSSNTFDAMLKVTAPKAQYANQVDSKTQSNFTCAVEGGDNGGSCSTSAKSGDELTKIMESAAMAARPGWDADSNMFVRSVSPDAYRGSVPIGIPIMNPSAMTDVMGEGNWMGFGMPSSAKVSNNKIDVKVGMSFAILTWRDGVGFGVTGEGKPPDSSNEYKGVPCDGSGGCFINFRTGSKDDDYNQPSTFGAVTQDLKLMREGDARPWELPGGSGSIDMGQGDKQWKFSWVPSDKGFAVAKGKVYFHDYAKWSAPPNLFDPFWRAKLHPFKDSTELKQILSSISDNSGELLSNNTAVEGKVGGQ